MTCDYWNCKESNVIRDTNNVNLSRLLHKWQNPLRSTRICLIKEINKYFT